MLVDHGIAPWRRPDPYGLDMFWYLEKGKTIWKSHQFYCGRSRDPEIIFRALLELFTRFGEAGRRSDLRDFWRLLASSSRFCWDACSLRTWKALPTRKWVVFTLQPGSSHRVHWMKWSQQWECLRTSVSFKIVIIFIVCTGLRTQPIFRTLWT